MWLAIDHTEVMKIFPQWEKKNETIIHLLKYVFA